MRAALGLSGWARGQPDVQVIVVTGELLDDSGWPCQLEGGPDEDELGTGGDEAVDERLSKPPVDVAGAARRALVAIASRQVDVGVEPVLM
jgi:hypothetical protein